MTITPLLAPRVHRLSKRLRDLEALRRRIDEEIAVVHAQASAARGRLPIHCGTERGYQWHRHQDRTNWPLPKHDPCGCRAAHRQHERNRLARQEAS